MPNTLNKLNTESKYWFLHDHQLFSLLSREENKALCLIPDFMTAQKGEIIFFAHDDQQRIYTVKKGIMKIVEIDEEGNEIINEVLRAGDLFGQYTFSSEKENEYAIAVSESVIFCSFNLQDFEDILERNPKLALKYTKIIGFKLKTVTNLYKNLMFKDVRTRFTLFLKDWAMKEADGKTKDIMIKNYLSHQDIAGLICSTRQTVSELFSMLRNENLIDYNRKELIIKDLSKL